MEEQQTPSFLWVAEALLEHGRPSQTAYALYELLCESEFDDEEIVAVANALKDIVS